MPGPIRRPRAAETREPGHLGALEELRERNAELEILCDTIRDVTSTLSVRTVLERLVDRALNHRDSQIASILLERGDDALTVSVGVAVAPALARCPKSDTREAEICHWRGPPRASGPRTDPATSWKKWVLRFSFASG